MTNYLDHLISLKQQHICTWDFIQMLRKKYELPECLPPMGMLPTKLEALEELSKQYPNDVMILQNLVIALKEQKG